MDELSIFAAAREAGSRECLVQGSITVSFSEMAERAAHVIASLLAEGIAPGDRVAFTPEVSIDSVAILHALFELGCPAVLLHPRLTKRERGALVENARPVRTFGMPSGVPDQQVARVPRSVPPSHALAIVHTSGSGGAPKGAILSRSAFVASCRAHSANLGWSPSDRWLLAMPPAHIGGLSIITRCLIARRCVVLLHGPFDPSQVIQALEAHRVTLLSLVPTMLARLLAHDAPTWRPDAELRAVLVGGAPLPEHLRAEAVARRVPIVSTYGCTEACSQVTTQNLSQIGHAGSGAPLEGISLRIREGEIQLKGPTMMEHYLPLEPSKKGTLPFSGDAWSEDGWFRTRDGGRLDRDGQLFVTGRLDEVIVSGGENVSPLEVETVLESLPEVSAVCVFSVPSDEWGEEVVAAVATRKLDRAALRSVLEDSLASFKRPKRVAVVDALPLNPSGKIDRKQTKERFADLLEPV